MAVPRKYKPLLARHGGGSFDRWARRNYGVTGYGLLARLIQGESGWNPNAVSSAGARGLTQFIPSTRQGFIRQHGIDPWKNPDNMVKAAKIHLRQYGGLRGYNPGMPSYQSYILGQNVGNVRRELKRQGFLDGTPSNGRGRSSGGQGGSGSPVASTALPAALSAPQPVSAPLSGIADPATSARRFLKMPEYGGDVPSSGPPSPNAPLSERLRSTAVPLSPTVQLGQGVPMPRSLGTVTAGQGRTVRTEEGKTYRWNGRGWVLQGKLGGPGAPRGGGRYRNATYRAPYGTTYGAPRDRAGERTDPVMRRFTRRLAGKTGVPITFGTGTRHSQMTSSGNVSDHWVGRGIDLPATGAKLTRMGAGALQLVGIPKKRAWQMARAGGIFNINYKGRRHQIIVNTTDHYDHLHVGISR